MRRPAPRGPLTDAASPPRSARASRTRVEPPPAFPAGSNLVEQANEEPVDSYPIFFTNWRGRWLDWDEGRAFDVVGLHAVDVGGQRLMWTEDGRDRVKLYDLRADPGAKKDLAKDQPGDVDRLKELVQDWLERGESRRPDVVSGGELAKDELRALGYLDDEN